MRLIDLDTDKEYLLDGKYKVEPITCELGLCTGDIFNDLLPPKDNEVYVNRWGCAIMNRKTFQELHEDYKAKELKKEKENE